MFIVDRIEGAYVVCEREDKSFVDIKKSLFPDNVKAGDVVYEEQGKYVICKEETKKRSEKINHLMNALWEDDN